MKQYDRSSGQSHRNEGNESAYFCRRNNHCLESFKKKNNNNNKKNHLCRDGTALKWIFSYSISYQLFLIRYSEDHNVTFIGFYNLVCYLNGKMVYTLCLRCAPRKTVWFDCDSFYSELHMSRGQLTTKRFLSPGPITVLLELI